MRPEPDSYEALYMNGKEAALSQRMMMPWWFHGLIAASMLGTAVGAFASGAYWQLLLDPMLLMLWVTFLFLRLTVTADFLHVQLGLAGPKIALGDIQEITSEIYPVVQFRGYGIRRGPGGSRAYSMPGPSGRALKILYSHDGNERVVWVTTEDPEAVIVAVRRAQARGHLRIAEAAPAVVTESEAGSDDQTTTEKEAARR